MMNNWNGFMTNGFGRPGLNIGFGLILVWTLIWKGLALWRAAKEDSKPWFAALLVINTMGILEIIYLFFIAQEKLDLSNLMSSSKSKKK